MKFYDAKSEIEYINMKGEKQIFHKNLPNNIDEKILVDGFSQNNFKKNL